MSTLVSLSIFLIKKQELTSSQNLMQETDTGGINKKAVKALHEMSTNSKS